MKIFIARYLFMYETRWEYYTKVNVMIHPPGAMQAVAASRNLRQFRFSSENFFAASIPKEIPQQRQIEPTASFFEKDLEQALIDHLQKFILELGRGFSFVARQKRFTFDGRHFYIDLVFYNYILKCFVLIDLKLGDLTHQDLGQMQMYVNYYTREMMNDGDNPPIGIVLCADKSDTIVKYTLSEQNTQSMGIRRGGKVPDQAGSSRTATKRIGEPVKPASFKGRAVQWNRFPARSSERTMPSMICTPWERKARWMGRPSPLRSSTVGPLTPTATGRSRMMRSAAAGVMKGELKYSRVLEYQPVPVWSMMKASSGMEPYCFSSRSTSPASILWKQDTAVKSRKTPGMEYRAERSASSMGFPPGTKCRGASMCVPV